MAGKKLSGVKVTTPKFRVNWPHVLTPQDPRPGDAANKKPQYSVQMLFDKEAMATPEFAKVKAALLAAGVEAWGADRKLWPVLKSTPFKDQGTALKKRDNGEEYLPDGYTKGCIMLSAHSNQQPGLIDGKKNKILDESEFYSGCYARAVVVFKAYNFLGEGLTCYLQHVQKISDGGSLSGRTTAEDSFSPLEDESGFETPTDAAGGDDLLGGAPVAAPAADPLGV